MRALRLSSSREKAPSCTNAGMATADRRATMVSTTSSSGRVMPAFFLSIRMRKGEVLQGRPLGALSCRSVPRYGSNPSC